MSHENRLPRVEKLLDFSFEKHVKVILQTEAAECGLACIAMVAGFHGFDTDLTSLRRKYSISTHGATLKQIMGIGSKMNLSSRALKVDLSQLSQLQTPCILHWEMNHFVILKEIKNNKVTILDPAVGERLLSLKEVGNLYTGIALELSPTTDFEKGEDKKQLGIHHFWSSISGVKRSLLIMGLLSLLLQAFAIVSPFYMQTVVDDVVLKNDHNLLFVLALGFAFLLVIEIFTNILREFVTLNMSTRLSIQMSANIFQHLIRLPMDYFLKRHVGDITSRFGSMSTIRELLTNGIVAVAIDGLMAIITLTVMFFYSVKLTFIVIGVVCLYAVFRYAFYKPIRLLSEEAIVASAKESSHFLESIRAVQTIKLLSKETDRQSQWQNKLADSMNKGIRMAKWNIGFSTVNRGLFGIENIVIIYFAANSVMDNVFSVGMLFAFMSYKGRFIGAMDNLISKWIEFRMLDLHFDRLADIVFTETDTLLEHQHPAGMNEQENSALQGKIEARNISFAYSETDSPVFKNLNFTITPGETVAIIGASGCGKSTLLKCLMSFTAVTEGSLLVDDCLIEKIPNYRSQIAGVLQDDQLLSGSISDNIACFDTKIDMEYVIQCAKQACMHDDISAMSMQYNTLVGDMGSNLSGGQKQRVIIARALYRRPKILFMDEATSHLDIQNEVVINQNIKHLDITRIIVAHRPETILSAERILQIHDGQLVDVTIDYRKAMGVQ